MANFKGYIASIGSAGALVAASLLILSIVGALVAFDGWPEPTSGGRAESVVGGAEHVTGTAEQGALERAGASGKAGRDAAVSAKADASDTVAAGVRLTRRGSGAGKPRRGPSGSGGRTGGRTAPVAVPPSGTVAVPPSGTSTPVVPSNGGVVAPAGGGPVSVPEGSGVSGGDHGKSEAGRGGSGDHERKTGKSGGKSHGKKDSKGN